MYGWTHTNTSSNIPGIQLTSVSRCITSVTMKAVLLVVSLLALCFLHAEAGTLTTPAVQFSNALYNSKLGAVSFIVTFQQPVASLNAQRLKLTSASNGASISLSGATFTSLNGGLQWNVSKLTGFNPSSPTAQLKATFVNVPPAVCKAPVGLVSVSTPTTVVGTGTPDSCTEAAFTSAIAAGGIITFNCGTSPVTITVTQVKNVVLSKDTVIDGNGLITLSGGGTTRIIAIQTTYDKLSPRVTLQNLAITGGYMTDVANTTATNSGGGALYRLGGAFTIINCDFYSNQGPLTGQDVAGGAIYSIGGSDTTIVGSTFSNNKCSNGGGIGNLGNSFALYNSIANANSATGQGGNPGNGGNGGAVCLDGQGVTTTICGSTLSYNSAGSFGGSLFRVGYTHNDYIYLQNCSFSYNQAASSAGAIYVQGLSVVLTNSTISFNYAPGGGGLALQYQASYTLSGVTIANNTATTSLGGGLYINSGTGTISDSTIVGNVATTAFASGIAGGDANTLLTKTIVAYGAVGNIYVGFSCFSSSCASGGGNFQFPQFRPDGNADSLCATTENFADPLLAPVADNGCITQTAANKAGSPATDAGARCAAGSVSPLYPLTYTNGQVVPRGPFSFTF